MLRLAQAADAAALVEIYGPYVEETAISFETQVPSVEEFQSRIQKTLTTYPYLVLELEGKIVGYAYASSFHPRAAYDWCAEISIYLAKDQQGRGYGRLLYQAMEEILSLQGILNVYACIATPEEEDQYLTFNSARYHQHLGYKQIGEFKQCGYKFGRWYNMVWMEKFLADHVSPAQPIHPLPNIRHQVELLLGEWNQSLA